MDIKWIARFQRGKIMKHSATRHEDTKEFRKHIIDDTIRYVF